MFRNNFFQSHSDILITYGSGEFFYRQIRLTIKVLNEIVKHVRFYNRPFFFFTSSFTSQRETLHLIELIRSCNLYWIKLLCTELINILCTAGSAQCAICTIMCNLHNVISVKKTSTSCHLKY